MYEFSTFSVFKFISLPLPLRFYCNEITTLMFNSFSSFIYIYIYILGGNNLYSQKIRHLLSTI